MKRRCVAVLALALIACLVSPAGPAMAAAAAHGPAKLPPGCTPWSEKGFVHPPLKVFEKFTRIDEFPIVAWCFHGRKKKFVPYDEKYARDAKACGFNLLIDAAAMLEPCRKVGGIKVVVPTFHHPPAKMMEAVFTPYGDHPALVGLVLDDNNPRIYPNVVQNAKWLVKNYPHVMPWISENPDPRTQSRTPIRVLGTQNYPFLRGARGSRAERAYCNGCNVDRWYGNNKNMSVWEIFGGHNSFCQIRYQMMTALAYGAQGVVNFAYTPHRTKMYMPGNPMIAKFAAMHGYITKVVGRHLWGTRCFDVIHSIHGGAHNNAPRPRSDRLVVKTSNYVMIGLLTPEKKFFSKDPAAADRAIPEYFMVVDKRTAGGEGTPEDMFLMLHTNVPAVEVLDAEALPGAKVRKIVPGFKIRRRTSHGEGLLLRVSPDLTKLLGGEKGAKLYAEINALMAALQWKLTPPPQPNEEEKKPDVQPPATPVAAAEADKAVKAAKAKLAELQKTLSAAVKAGTISQAQAADTIDRLRAAIDATRKEAGE